MLNENEGLKDCILLYVLDKKKFLMLLFAKCRALFSPFPPPHPKEKKNKKKEKGNLTLTPPPTPSKCEEKDTLKWGCVVGSP